jgi:predicted exporter
MNSLFLKFWILIHVVVISIALCTLPWKIEANFTEIIATSKAEKAWMQNNSSSFAILVGHEDFETAKNSAMEFYDYFSKDSSLKYLELFIDDSALDDLRAFFFKYRYQLQSGKFIAADIKEIKAEALSRIYGLSIASLENLELDPFLLGENWLFELASFGNFKIIDDMRVAELNGVNYILLTGKIAHQPFLEILEKMREKATAVSGIPFHVYESSSNAKREITIIATISMALIVFLIICLFRSPFPLFSMVGMILIASLFAASATRLVFGEIHILTFVFGTSLIGISTDYALHFFAHWKAGGKNGFEVRSQIISCISLSFLTTMLGYTALMLTPFPLLRQMALFSFAGLLSAFLTVAILFPYVKPSHPTKFRAPFFLGISKLKIPFLIAACLIAVPGLSRLQIKNDVAGFYSMSKELKHSEYLMSQVMNSGSGLFYLVQGSSPEETLANEEALCSKLDSIGNYLALTKFLPSVATQQKTYSFIEQNLLLPADSMLLELDFDSSAIYAMRNDFAASKGKFLTSLAELPAVFRQAAERLWLGEIDGTYYSIAIPLEPKKKSEYAAINLPNVEFIDKANSVDAELTGISKMALLLMLAAYALVFALLCFLYGLKTASQIVAVPLLAVITAVSIMSIYGKPLTFFAVNGIILTLAIGIDYALFFAKGKGDISVISTGTLFSMLTTLLAFGTLSFSSFVPVASFGLAAFLGIFGCFFFTILLYSLNTPSPLKTEKL